MCWNSDTNPGRAALCWKLDFDVETIVNLRQRFSSRSRTEKIHGRTVLLQSEKCQNIFLSLCFLFPKARRFCGAKISSRVISNKFCTLVDLYWTVFITVFKRPQHRPRPQPNSFSAQIHTQMPLRPILILSPSPARSFQAVSSLQFFWPMYCVLCNEFKYN